MGLAEEGLGIEVVRGRQRSQLLCCLLVLIAKQGFSNSSEHNKAIAWGSWESVASRLRSQRF